MQIISVRGDLPAGKGRSVRKKGDNTMLLRLIATAFVMALLVAAPAHATVIAESGDAGGDIGSAQDAGGADVTGITGNAGDFDNDFFKFTFLESVVFQVGNLLPNVNGNFSVDIINLALRDEDGNFIQNCGDCWFAQSGTGNTVISEILAAGVYFLSVESSDLLTDPLGNYSMDIAIRTAPPTGDAPEPATLALVGLGLAGLGIARRRRA